MVAFQISSNLALKFVNHDFSCKFNILVDYIFSFKTFTAHDPLDYNCFPSRLHILVDYNCFPSSLIPSRFYNADHVQQCP